MLTLLSYRTLAYVPDSGHLPLTEIAVQGYNLCYPNEPLSASVKDRLKQGNYAMDHGMGKLNFNSRTLDHAFAVFSLVSRTTNWHFYNPHKKAHSRQENVEMSYERLWQRAQKGFEQAKQPHDKWLFVGALLHLLEDTSVPAHVVPVYHGPTVAVSWLGEFAHLTHYMKNKSTESGFWLAQSVADGIDKMPVQSEKLLKHLKQNKRHFCRQINKSDNFKLIREQLAVETLTAIEKPIKDCKQMTWSSFWRDNNPGKLPSSLYFKRYNTDKGFPLFSQQGVITTDSAKVSCTMQQNDERYLNFVYQQHLSAIISNIRLIVAMKAKIL